MNKIVLLIKYFFDKKVRFDVNNYNFHKYDKLPDEQFLKMEFENKMGYKLDLENPTTACELFQWYKLYYRDPLFSKIVDKSEFKKYVESKLGDGYTIPTLGIYNSFEEINFDVLPNKFIIKTTHSSGGFVVCNDKTTFDINKAKKIINKSLKTDYYITHREWAYKHASRKIIIEPLIESLGKSDSIEYKIITINGKVELFTICRGIAHTFNERKNDFYDRNFNKLDMEITYNRNSHIENTKPLEFDKLIELSEKLSEGIPHVRCDFYVDNGKIYVGEMTFYTWAGLINFIPKEWDLKLGSKFIIPAKITND